MFKYPFNCDSPRRRTEFLYKAQEELRLLHNVLSKWLHEGIPREQYNLLPEKIKIKYPFDQCNVKVIPVVEDYSKVAIADGGEETKSQEISSDIISESEEIRLSKTIWDKFQKEDFTPRSDKICQEICVQRALLKTSDWLVDLGEI